MKRRVYFVVGEGDWRGFALTAAQDPTRDVARSIARRVKRPHILKLVSENGVISLRLGCMTWAGIGVRHQPTGIRNIVDLKVRILEGQR